MRARGALAPEHLENCLLLLLVEVLLHQLGRAQGMLGIQAVPSQNGPGVPESLGTSVGHVSGICDQACTCMQFVAVSALHDAPV